MSDARHTPGPWEVEPHGDTHALYSGRTAERHGLRLMNLDDGDANFDANARLIAASPDLLAVLLAYERWEADMLLCQEAWAGGVAEFPTLTAALWDRLLEIQAMRNAAKQKALGEGQLTNFPNQPTEGTTMAGKVMIQPLKDDGGPATPGPWKVIPPGHGHPGEYLCVQIGADESYATLEMRPADARLAAAAPDLLAACEEWVAYLDDGDAIYSDEETAMIRRTRAAIAKAKG